jgi:hypothetical protein
MSTEHLAAQVRRPTPFSLEPIHIPVAAGCAYIGKSRSAVYEAIGKGQIQAVKDGFRTLLVFESLKRFAAARAPAAIGKGNEHFKEMRKRVKHPGGKRRMHSRKRSA